SVTVSIECPYGLYYFNGYCYSVNNYQSVRGFDALMSCTALKDDLVSIYSEEENFFLMESHLSSGPLEVLMFFKNT
ncbi:hypothetical protein B4U80_14742, partial [Leptotrombidium deliense]